MQSQQSGAGTSETYSIKWICYKELDFLSATVAIDSTIASQIGSDVECTDLKPAPEDVTREDVDDSAEETVTLKRSSSSTSNSKRSRKKIGEVTDSLRALTGTRSSQEMLMSFTILA